MTEQPNDPRPELGYTRLLTRRRGAPYINAPFPLPYRLGCVRMNLGHLVRAIPRSVLEFVRRGRWGWAPSDTWGFDNYLCGVIGAGLMHMADHSHGYPPGYMVAGAEDSEEAWAAGGLAWSADLREHGTALLDHAWGEMWDDDAEARGELASKALRWVADNHWSLWD